MDPLKTEPIPPVLFGYAELPDAWEASVEEARCHPGNVAVFRTVMEGISEFLRAMREAGTEIHSVLVTTGDGGHPENRAWWRREHPDELTCRPYVPGYPMLQEDRSAEVVLVMGWYLVVDLRIGLGPYMSQERLNASIFAYNAHD